MDNLDALAQLRCRDARARSARERDARHAAGRFRELLETRRRSASSCSTSPGCGGISEAKKIADAWPRPSSCRSRRTTAPARSVSPPRCHLSINAPNALVQESVRAFYTGWYRELVTALPEVRDGTIAPPPGPGLGLDLLPDIAKRPDVSVRSSTAG